MNTPKVSIICISYNQANTIQQTLLSVANQNFKKEEIELIIVDDASKDHTSTILKQLQLPIPYQLVIHQENKGYCKTFNEGLHLSNGRFILDLAADDLLHPEFLQIAVNRLEESNDKVAAHYCDAFLLDININEKILHSEQTKYKKRPEGTIYKELIQHYFICSPTVLFKRKHLIEVGGYDENLMYEDFDIQIRLARKFNFLYTPKPLLTKQISKSNMSAKQVSWRSPYQYSTYVVCKKIQNMNLTKDEHKALFWRCFYEIKKNIQLGNFKLTLQYTLLAFQSYLKS